MDFETELKTNHPELLSDWDRTKQSWQAKSLILELYRVYGYEAARIAVDAAVAVADNEAK